MFLGLIATTHIGVLPLLEVFWGPGRAGEPLGPARALRLADQGLGRQEGSRFWADLREDKMINQAPGFWPIFGPSGPTAGPGSLGTGSGSKTSASCTKMSSGDQL